jgi:hypothetical protein
LRRIDAERDLAIAARERLRADLALVRKNETAAADLVGQAVEDVGIDHAMVMAAGVLALDEALRNKRHALKSLLVALADRNRRVAFPALVNRAVTVVDEVLHGVKATQAAPDYRARLKALFGNAAAEL